MFNKKVLASALALSLTVTATSLFAEEPATQNPTPAQNSEAKEVLNEQQIAEALQSLIDSGKSFKEAVALVTQQFGVNLTNDSLTSFFSIIKSVAEANQIDSQGDVYTQAFQTSSNILTGYGFNAEVVLAADLSALPATAAGPTTPAAPVQANTNRFPNLGLGASAAPTLNIPSAGNSGGNPNAAGPVASPS